jgi:LAO/AO transport system kinase
MECVVGEPMNSNAKSVIRAAVAGDRRSLARGISLLEGNDLMALEALAEAKIRRHEGPGMPHVVGITGPPGAGKSTFVNRAVAVARAKGARVAVVAVDPSSPFSGGALLGDRVRMSEHASDDGVFIRSLSSRGSLGGLSTAVSDVIDLFDAAGFDKVILETVGVGQSELSIMEVADTVVVVLTPESGDTVQTMKAGLLEVADIFVVNKADRPGAELLRQGLEFSISLDGEKNGYVTPVFTTSARDNKGISEVMDAVFKHGEWCVGGGLSTWRERRGRAQLRQFMDAAGSRVRMEAHDWLLQNPQLESRLLVMDISPSALWELFDVR